MRQYGLPYKGCKSAIAEWVCAVLPRGERLCDLFAGGCAVTHCAMLAGKWGRFFASDIADAPQLFLDAVCGRYRGESRWVSRDDFLRLKDSDPYVRLCWSFGNNCETYMYSREIEPCKRAVHYAVVLDDWREMRRLCPEVSDAAEAALAGMADRKARRVEFGRAVVLRLKDIGDARLLANPLYRSCHFSGGKRDIQRLQSLESLQSLERLERLQSLERLERLQSLERLESLERLQSLERLEVARQSYAAYRHEAGDVVYCDPPYITKHSGAKQYGAVFDREAFLEWSRTRDYPVYISEYSMPPDFVPVAQKSKVCSVSATTSFTVTESIFVYERWADVASRGELKQEQLEFDFI